MDVSIIIPTYQRFQQVQESINSALEQKNVKTEIIVIDDCSSDPQYKLLEGMYKNSNVKIIHLPINMRRKYNVKAAQGKTRWEGIKIATGEWIAFLDDDDAWCNPLKLKEQIDMMKKHGCLLSCSNMYSGNGPYSRNLNQKSTYFPMTFSIGKEREKNVYKFDRKCIEKVNYVNNSSCVIHKSIAEKVGEFKEGRYEDYDYWLRSLKFTDGLYIRKPYVYYDNYHGGCNHYS